MIKAAPQPDALLSWMGGLADATRLRLLRVLERQELGVVELCDVLQMPQSTVSRHLKILADQKWVAGRRHGTTNFYRMRTEELDAPARRLWQLAREQTHDWPTLQQDQLRLTRLVRDRRDDAQAFFAGAASQWDKLRSQLYGESFAHEAMLALLPSDWVVADLGCGAGATAASLAGHVKRVVGVDQSEPMLKAARKRTADLPNVELKRGDLEAVPLDDASCDAALLLLVLTYVAEPEAVLREAARILKPGGRLVIVDLLRHDREDFRRQLDQHWMGFEIADLEAWIRNAGFAKATCRPLPPEPQAKGPALVLATGERNV